ncbi:hypothetical protein ASPWEDRAFT_35885 [Aspergillus wentii DTO 134E9]|uniref:Mitochondrial pyruvate carrier n=1 Tax=Aspergillus wentii DTO 134E9 TaxID=1073089 RepID=A0A1L9RTN7_ASPWE|nr:uncharacterized protein ASPWEDRAFT_35885 [Aspergillus wentii DTO 134E9]KAI9933912.1 hypothetical protein MW887_004984 [Aspergillus wentii]OJJ38264.1 hypothetical protein ASPWEDRAFT_35885 [Aspergillus wentii DTO 134E9]
MSSRVGFRFLNNARAAFRNTAGPFRRPGAQGRRFQSSDAGASTAEQQSTFQRLWNSPVGVKTVHFWAPVMKWALVIAGISDLGRPAEKLSLTQNGALMATGAIWTRWCLIIKPRNVLLATVNFFLGCVGVAQVSRIIMYRRSLKDGSTTEAAKELTGEAADSAKAVAEKAEAVVEKKSN